MNKSGFIAIFSAAAIALSSATVVSAQNTKDLVNKLKNPSKSKGTKPRQSNPGSSRSNNYGNNQNKSRTVTRWITYNEVDAMDGFSYVDPDTGEITYQDNSTYEEMVVGKTYGMKVTSNGSTGDVADIQIDTSDFKIEYESDDSTYDGASVTVTYYLTPKHSGSSTITINREYSYGIPKTATIHCSISNY